MEIVKNLEYEIIGKMLIETMPELDYIRDSMARIVFLESNEQKKKDRRIIFADCSKVEAKYKWCCNYDFMITVYQPNVELYEFNAEQIEALIFHELLHVGIDNEGNEPSYYVAPHDIEEFYSVINRYGENWQRRTN